MYEDNTYDMNLYFIHLHYATRVTHGDMCSFMKLNYMVTRGNFISLFILYFLIN
jgi:hypothetical protein